MERKKTGVFSVRWTHQCSVNYKFPWIDAAKIQLSEFEGICN